MVSKKNLKPFLKNFFYQFKSFLIKAIFLEKAGLDEGLKYSNKHVKRTTKEHGKLFNKLTYVLFF